MILCDFRSIRPRFIVEQGATLSWLSLAHARAEVMKNEGTENQDEEWFAERIAKLFLRYGCSSDRIATRGLEISDFSHTRWNEMEIFNFKDSPFGPTTTQRSEKFREIGTRVCAELFTVDQTPPDHIIHVTCSGYLSPSCAQEQVAQNRWHDKTVVTHAYHMGCYAAVPAIRIADGYLAAALNSSNGSGNSSCVNILHTEVCSLHVQVHDHSPEQLVVQSLFADGFIVYSGIQSNQQSAMKGSGLLLKALHEEIIPDSADAITWACSEWGMRMGLSAEVPGMIASALEPFLQKLCDRGGMSFDAIKEKSVFAVHPGGPKIIDRVQALLNLQDEQVSVSRFILLTCGNMSSATLPHIWEKIVADENVASGTYVISLAFGPGLCISGALLQKVG
ncbi:MAG: naringenin-chalcone synthase [Candidatus Riflebacteria bacterium]|nr:naringenin-chalcone synthase [Candidatus Riflebacteria bacterium]